MLAYDAQAQEELEKGRAAVLQEEEDNQSRLKPTFVPASDCSRIQSFGHSIYLKAALLTAAEFTKLVGMSPTDLDVKPWSSEFKAPGELQQYYTLSLEGLAEDVRQSCRKVKVYMDMKSQHASSFLNQTNQLSSAQPARTFEHVTGQYGEKRPQLGMPPTLMEMKEKMEAFQSAMQKALASRRTPAASAESEAADAPEGEAKQPQQHRMLEAISMNVDEPVAKRRRQKVSAAAVLSTPSSSRAGGVGSSCRQGWEAHSMSVPPCFCFM